MKKYLLKNHRFILEKQAQIAINERGFLFGDGVFETCKIYNGKIYNFKSHQARLQASLQALQIFYDIKNLEENSLKLIKKNKIKNGILRISITRGIGSIGYLPTSTKPLTIIQTLKNRPIPKKISLTISPLKKPSLNHKTHNALPYILNKLYAQQNQCFDAIMLAAENYISETSSANIFWVKNNKIYTSSLECDIVIGTIRSRLLALTKITEKKAKLSELENADEIFLTNAASLVIPVDTLIFNAKHTIKLTKKIGPEIKKLLTNDVKKFTL